MPDRVGSVGLWAKVHILSSIEAEEKKSRWVSCWDCARVGQRAVACLTSLTTTTDNQCVYRTSFKHMLIVKS